MQRTLLLVDDEENILSALARLLRRDGYTILRAASGAAGLEILSQHTVGVIISDQRMPEMTGVEFLSRAREMAPDTVRIVLSGYTDLNSVTDAVNRGAIFKFLAKPWDDEQLRVQVGEAFRYHEMAQENLRLNQQLQSVNAELSALNKSLEQRVEDKTRELRLNIHALQVSQAVLEELPLAVLGIGDDGLIAVANRVAHELFSGSHDYLVGQLLTDVLPDSVAGLCDVITGAGDREISVAGLPRLSVSCARLGDKAQSGGTVLVMRRL